MTEKKEIEAKEGYKAGRDGGDLVGRFFGIGTSETYWKNFEQGRRDQHEFGKREQPSVLEGLGSSSKADSSGPATYGPTDTYSPQTSTHSTSSSAAPTSSSGLLPWAVAIFLGLAFLGSRTNSPRTEPAVAPPIKLLPTPRPADTDELPSEMSASEQSTFRAWLRQNPRFRPAQIADCFCLEDLPFIRKLYANVSPYYAKGDFNGDGAKDFAIVVIDRTIPAPAPSSTNFNSSLVVFSATDLRGKYVETILPTRGAPNGSLLFLSRDPESLAVGLWEGEASPLVATPKGYALQ